MKKIYFAALFALVSASAMAQAPAGTVARPSAETNPIAAGGAPAAKAEMKAEAKRENMPTRTMGINAMDTNGDGKVSRREWNAYHNATWKGMKRTRGMATMADVEAAMKGGPN